MKRFTTLGPLALSLLFAAYSPPAHAVKSLYLARPALPALTERHPLMVGQGDSQEPQRDRITIPPAFAANAATSTIPTGVCQIVSVATPREIALALGLRFHDPRDGDGAILRARKLVPHDLMNVSSSKGAD